MNAEITAHAAAIARAVHPLSIVLFGSSANDTATTDSDIDLLVVIDDTADALDAGIAARKSLGAHRTPVDVVVVHAKDCRSVRTSPQSVIGNALRTGRVVYERAA